MHLLAALISGLLFGLGLIASQMVNPTKVLNFLDVTGDWDPSLMFVMVGAIVVSFFAFKKAKKLPQTCIGEKVVLPTQTKLAAP